ncbi:hypothetical protein GXW78_03520 [Roseomonas terrae]|uniref:Uncharacterized protein n=1 Tax=Neoroseomonas terrae TaxID=424799 RepID=A0ABS5ECH6_9PROT|nr:hypothetical protein [Neoroseomonas terrae]MBR0648716.1 hypothetical protein [Neoroseomonas terrae]
MSVTLEGVTGFEGPFGSVFFARQIATAAASGVMATNVPVGSEGKRLRHHIHSRAVCDPRSACDWSVLPSPTDGTLIAP